jgi:hypothetical protein
MVRNDGNQCNTNQYTWSMGDECKEESEFGSHLLDTLEIGSECRLDTASTNHPQLS